VISDQAFQIVYYIIKHMDFRIIIYYNNYDYTYPNTVNTYIRIMIMNQ